MFSLHRGGLAIVLAAAAGLLLGGGCTSPSQYFRNGLKVGPNYCPPAAPVAPQWIDAADARLRRDSGDLAHWWVVLNDPCLNRLIDSAYRQNLTLREAGFRILQARAQLAIVRGELFPQQQGASGGYRRTAAGAAGGGGGMGPTFFDQWNDGFTLAWELDFWGRYRRAITAADAQLDASVGDYDQVLVTLLGDVASNYVQFRTDQERIKLLRANVELQQGILNFIETRLKAGFRVTDLDAAQARSNLRQTEAAIPQLEIDQRQMANRLCILLGMPPFDLEKMLGTAPIPSAPPDVVVGVPADLLRRRPDVRRAERLAAAQAEQIGIAEADFYPAFSINGTLGYSARDFSHLFTSKSLNGSVGPSFQWNLLNYGRLQGNVRWQDARFQELVLSYQSTVLQANREAEDGMITFLHAQERSKLLDESVKSAEVAVKIVVVQFKTGAVDFNRYALIQQNLVQQQDLAAQAHGQIAQGLIQVYRALGGGWEMRLAPPAGGPVTVPLPAPPPRPAQAPPAGAEEIPVPPQTPLPLPPQPDNGPVR